MMRRIPGTVVGTALVAALLLLCGCASRLTYERFDLIRVEADSRADVQALLGEPDARFDDEWIYDDRSRRVAAIVYFDAEGRVAGKEWIDAERSTFEGGRPGAADTPAGEVIEERRTRRTYDD